MLRRLSDDARACVRVFLFNEADDVAVVVMRHRIVSSNQYNQTIYFPSINCSLADVVAATVTATAHATKYASAAVQQIYISYFDYFTEYMHMRTISHGLRNRKNTRHTRMRFFPTHIDKHSAWVMWHRSHRDQYTRFVKYKYGVSSIRGAIVHAKSSESATRQLKAYHTCVACLGSHYKIDHKDWRFDLMYYMKYNIAYTFIWSVGYQSTPTCL